MQKITEKWAREMSGVLQDTVAGMMTTSANPLAKIAIRSSVGNLVKATAVGLVAAFGTAGTGTAISTLSGAAAKSALLAWFGGGSMLIGGYVVLPALTFAAGWMGFKALTKKAKREPEELSDEEQAILHRCYFFASVLTQKADGDKSDLSLSPEDVADLKQLDADIGHCLRSDSPGMKSVRKRTLKNHRALSELLAFLP